MGPDFLENLAGERVRLEFRRFAQQMAVDAGIMAEIELRMGQGSSYDFLQDQIMVQMVAKILVDDLPPEKVRQSTSLDVEEPATTWQMWKRNNRGKWYTWKWLDAWVKRWPVKTRTYRKAVHCEFNLERYRTYPRARVSAPVLGNAVLFHTVSDVRWDGDL